MKFLKYLGCATAFAVSTFSFPVFAQISGTASLTSDYVWRGSSPIREKPAMQASIKYAHSSGFYASAWGSNVKFKPDNGASSEFDLAAGWAGQLTEQFALDVLYLRYQYPGTTVGLNWNEINAALTWRKEYWLAVGQSSNAMASKTSGTYVTLGARYPVSDAWRLEATASRYFLKNTYAKDYSNFNASAVWVFQAPFELRAALHAIDRHARNFFPGMAGTRAEVAIQTSF